VTEHGLLGCFEVVDERRGAGGASTLLLRVPPPDHAVFEGHFPGDPLVPAWVLLALVQGVAADARGFVSVRFRGAVRPGDELRVDVDGARFTVSTASGTAAAGRLALDGA